jgi:hypothetical protein
VTWWGDTTGWNTGWYGNGYNNNGYNNTGNGTTYTPDGFNPDTDSNHPGTNSPTTIPSEPSAAGVAAQVTNAVDKSPEMVAANNAVQLAQVAYDQQRQQVLATLQDKPEYRQALARRHEAARDLKAAKASPTSAPAVLDAATAKLDAADEVTKIQEQAIATDPAAAAAKTHLAETVADRDALRAKLLAQH